MRLKTHEKLRKRRQRRRAALTTGYAQVLDAVRKRERGKKQSPVKSAKPKRDGGRPPKLQPDETTLGFVEGLAKIGATHTEAAVVLGVTRETFDRFICKHKKAEEAFENGRGLAKISLRRAQFRSAMGGNAAMLIWLGKQFLGQKDTHMSRDHTRKETEYKLELVTPGDERGA